MSNTDYKEKVLKSIEHFSKKDAKKKFHQPRKNNKPEAEFVKDKLIPWFKKNKFDIDIIESKAVYSVAAGRYQHTQATVGMSDCVGNDSFGRGAYIEAKDPTRPIYIREAQKEFLLRKIDSCCFAVCVNSVDELEKLYREFMTFSLTQAKIYLKSMLNQIPVKLEKKRLSYTDDKLFED